MKLDIRKIFVLIATFVLANTCVAENITQKSFNKARTIIDAAVVAFGGEERLNALSSVIIEVNTEYVQGGQSRKPEPPWDRYQEASVSAINYDEKLFVQKARAVGEGPEYDVGTIINGDDSFQLDYRAGTATQIAQPDFNVTSGPFARVTPVFLVRLLASRAHTAHYLGEAKVNGHKHDVISFVMEVGPAISLYFDKKTHLLSKSERVLPVFGLIEYYFTDYTSIDGIPFNSKFELFVDGDMNMVRKSLSTKTGVSLNTLTTVDSSLVLVGTVEPDELSLQKLSDGVYLVGGSGTYAMFVELKDYIVAVGGTAGIPDRIKELRKVVPTKPIKFGVLTHHHSDHIVGATAYAEEGATVIASAAHQKVVKESVDKELKLELESVEKERTITDGEREIRLIDIGPTPHTDHLLVAYLPKEGILFEADHFAKPRVGPVAPATKSAISFSQALINHDLKVNTIVSAHSPLTASMEDLNAALAKQVTVGQVN